VNEVQFIYSILSSLELYFCVYPCLLVDKMQLVDSENILCGSSHILQ